MLTEQKKKKKQVVTSTATIKQQPKINNLRELIKSDYEKSIKIDVFEHLKHFSWAKIKEKKITNNKMKNNEIQRNRARENSCISRHPKQIVEIQALS